MFEEDFFENAKELDSQALVTRLYDTTNGFRGVANPCDYIAATEFGTVFLELKTTIETSLSFNNITENQWFQLSRAERCKFSLAGILVYFQKHEKIIWYPISTLEQIKQAGIKSVNPNFIEGYEVAYKKRRTRLTIPFQNVLDAIKLHYEEKSNGKT